MTLFQYFATSIAFSMLLGACAAEQPTPHSFLDTNKDRRISVPEMEVGLATVVHGIADSNADEEITFDEIVSVYSVADRDEFIASDSDGSGTLSLTELHGAIDRSGGFKSLMSDIDINGNSVIDPAEAARFHDAMVTSESVDDLTKIGSIVDEKSKGEINSAFGKMLGHAAERRKSVYYTDRYRYGTFGRPYSNRPYYYRPHRPHRPNRPVRPPNRPTYKPGVPPRPRPSNPLIQPR